VCWGVFRGGSLMHWADTPIPFLDFEGNAASGIIDRRGGPCAQVRSRGDAQRLSGRGTAIAPRTRRCNGLTEGGCRRPAPSRHEWEYFAGLAGKAAAGGRISPTRRIPVEGAWAYPAQCTDCCRPGQNAAEWGPWIDTGRLYQQSFPATGRRKRKKLVAARPYEAELETMAARHCTEAGDRITPRYTMRSAARCC